MKAPLAFRIRPKNITDIIGQAKLVGPNGFLTNSIKSKTLFSIIFFGPPGTGKTTIAEAYANSLKVHYIKLNAVTNNKKDIETALEEAKLFDSCIIIMDEVHRLNKDKQDILLPYLEEGKIYLLGATTANPYIAINPAIRSRCHLLELTPLTQEDVIQGIKRALSHPLGFDGKVSLEDSAIALIAKAAGGDLRFALNYLEVIVTSTNKTLIDKDDVTTILKVPNYKMDEDESEHYDSVSALQKSIRGSDVDASLYYLARLCISEDLESIERRLLVTAYEDIGLASPGAVDRTINALDSARKVGFPEAIIPLGFAVCDLALSPKSKASTLAIEKAMELAKTTPLDVLDYLHLTPVNVKDEDKYPYDRPDLWEKIQYLPELIKNMKFYVPNNESKYEKSLNQNYDRLLKIKRSRDLAGLKKNK